MSVESIVRSAVENILSGYSDLFLVHLVVKGNAGNQRVVVMVDGDDRFDIDRCADVSRKLGSFLEENDSIEGKYTLEVSSPGLDMPLAIPRQYQKNIGRRLHIETKDGDSFTAELTDAGEDSIHVLDKGQKEQKLTFEEIKRARVEVSFN